MSLKFATFRRGVTGCAVALLAAWSGLAAAVSGQVLDAETRQPIAAAVVTAGNTVVRTDAQGNFEIAAEGNQIGVRAAGYWRVPVELNPQAPAAPLKVSLKPVQPKALYLSFYGIGSKVLRGRALELIESTELNSLVVDIKGDRGMLPYPSKVALATQIGGRTVTTVRDMPALVEQLHAKGIYLIARIVVFKDTLLAAAKPELAVRSASGAIWHDREKLAWVDPFKQEVWTYTLDIAEEAAQMGFDEIQFDYVRFPDTPGLVYSKPNTYENRVEAITGFLHEARRRLARYNVFLAADIFGYTCWNLNDTFIGQQIEKLGEPLDYLSPMLYPSGYQFGIPGYTDPVANSYEIVSLSLARAQQRTGLPGVRFRPWLQAFKDYAFDRRTFGAGEIRAQIDASERNRTNGWMLWNPRNQYSDAGLKGRKGAATQVAQTSQPAAAKPAGEAPKEAVAVAAAAPAKPKSAAAPPAATVPARVAANGAASAVAPAAVPASPATTPVPAAK